MKTRGVLFNKDMVIACLTCAKCGKLSRPFPCVHCGSTEFLKKQTRRIITPQPKTPSNGSGWDAIRYFSGPGKFCWSRPHPNGGFTRALEVGGYPYITSKLGTAGDFLYVRETARLVATRGNQGFQFEYLADGTKSGWDCLPDRIKLIKLGHCCSNGCFKELARIWLKITGVRAERVKDASESDVKAEGIETYWDAHQMWYKDYTPGATADFNGYDGWQKSFKSLIDLIYPGAWEKAWNFAYDISRIEQPNTQ